MDIDMGEVLSRVIQKRRLQSQGIAPTYMYVTTLQYTCTWVEQSVLLICHRVILSVAKKFSNCLFLDEQQYNCFPLCMPALHPQPSDHNNFCVCSAYHHCKVHVYTDSTHSMISELRRVYNVYQRVGYFSCSCGVVCIVYTCSVYSLLPPSLLSSSLQAMN